MQTAPVTANPTVDMLLGLLSWLVIVFGSVWLVTSIIGYFHRRAYNLTLAESGGSPIRPDFLKVDKKRRKEAIERGEEYAEVLEKRAEADARAAQATAQAQAKAQAAQSPAMQKLGNLSRAAALTTATLTLVGAVVGTLTKVQAFQSDVQQLSGWDSFVETVKAYPVGATVALLVIGANILVFVQASKTTAKS